LNKYITLGMIILLFLSSIVDSTFKPAVAQNNILYTHDFSSKFALLSSSSEPPRVEWRKVYGGDGLDAPESLIQTSDGGYAIAGYTTSLSYGREDFWLIKFDSFGNEEWNKTYGGAVSEIAFSVIQTDDGGYVLVGGTSTFGAGGADFWVLKTNSFGEPEWNKTYGGPNWDVAYSIVQTIDGYVIGGCTRSFGSGGSDFWLIKIDEYGNKIWDKTYGGSGHEGMSLIQSSDGGYALAGYTTSYGAGEADVWIVKTDMVGNIQWNKTYGGTQFDYACSVIQTFDGGYALAGATDNHGDFDFLLVKTDSNGNMQWNRTYRVINYGKVDEVRSVVQTHDGGYALIGIRGLSYITQFSGDCWLVKTDAEGEMQWNKTWGGQYRDYGRDILQTSDNGFLVAALIGDDGAGAGDLELTKFAGTLENVYSLQIQSTPVTGVSVSYTGDYFGAQKTNFAIGPKDSPFTVTLTAQSTFQNYKFSYWQLDGTNMGANSSLTVNVDDAHKTRTALAVYVPETLDSIASQYAKSGEAYRILELKIGNNPYSVILYYPSSITSPNIEDLTGAIVVDGLNFIPLIASEDSTQNFVVNSSLTLALAKMRGWAAPDPNFWADLNQKAKEAYISLLVMYGGMQALWITVEFAATGPLSAADIAAKIVEVANFALGQIETLQKIGGVTDAILKCNDAIVFAKNIYDGVDALQTIYEAYKVDNLVSMNQMIEHANKIAYMKTAVYLIETSVDYVYTDDIGGMATSWLEAGEFTKTLEGICRHMSTVVNSIVDGTVTPPQIHSLLASQIAYARFALLTWSAMTNMYQNIVNKGVFNVWYWLLDAPNSLKHYQQLYNNWQSVLASYEKQQKDFYNAIDRLFQQSVQRVLMGDPVSSLSLFPAENTFALFLMTFYITCFCLQRHIASPKKLKLKSGRKAHN